MNTKKIEDIDKILVEPEFKSIIERLEPFSIEEEIEVERLSLENHRTLLEHNTKRAYEALESTFNINLANLEIQRNQKNSNDALQVASIIIGSATTFPVWLSLLGSIFSIRPDSNNLLLNFYSFLGVILSGFILKVIINILSDLRKNDFRLVIPINYKIKDIKKLYEFIKFPKILKEDGIGLKRSIQWKENFSIDNEYTKKWGLLNENTNSSNKTFEIGRHPISTVKLIINKIFNINKLSFKITMDYDNTGIIDKFTIEKEYSSLVSNKLKKLNKAELIIQIIKKLFDNKCLPVTDQLDPTNDITEQDLKNNQHGTDRKSINDISLLAKILEGVGIELNEKLPGFGKLLSFDKEELKDMYRKYYLSEDTGKVILLPENQEFIKKLEGDKDEFRTFIKKIKGDPVYNELENLLGKRNLEYKYELLCMGKESFMD